MGLAGAVLAWAEKQRKTNKDDHLLRTRSALLFFLPVVCFLLALYLLFWCWRLFRFIADPSFFAETAIGLANTHALVTAGVVIVLAAGAYMAVKVLERWLSGETGGVRVLAEEQG
jgi:small-conductance mechanosensitive channel